MAILTSYFYKKECEYYDYQAIIENVQKSANLKYQELYHSSMPILFREPGSPSPSITISNTPSPILSNGSVLHKDDIEVTLNRSFNNFILN